METRAQGRSGEAGPFLRSAHRARALVGPMRIRKKLILLHTTFSFALAAILLLSLRPVIRDVVATSEAERCRLALTLLTVSPGSATPDAVPGLSLVTGSAREVGLGDAARDRALAEAGRIVMSTTRAGWPRAALYDEAAGVFHAAALESPAARQVVLRMYGLVALVLLAVYGLIALTVEVFVLPRQVYGPIQRLRRADEAVQRGRRDEELILESAIPSDELGEIMRSRNESIVRLRANERELADALERIERIAADLKLKNHMLETARRNLADQDRLASLGMMSAGLAHELNTPLAVLKGSVERIVEGDGAVSGEHAQLMLRVVQRLERLSESLLDFARVRPPSRERVGVRMLVDEAWTLVRLDREARGVEFENAVAAGATLLGDADRLAQVFVNVLRNAADAMGGAGRIVVSAEETTRDGGAWLTVRCRDTGPGIPPEALPRLFEPFVTTRLDARGAGLGLAVSEGIVRQHGGLIVARNAEGGGAIFEIVLPLEETRAADTARPLAGSGAGL